MCFTGLVHDRRVDGEALTFGKQGALFKRAMTWWDHKTESVWSQPCGTAIGGPLEGTALTLIPASVVPWPTWLDEHPETTVMANDLDLIQPQTAVPQNEFDRTIDTLVTTRGDFVIGVALEESAAAYLYTPTAERRVINDRVGEHPIVVLADAETRDINVYLRRPAATIPDGSAPSELTFELDHEGRLVDTETGSVWDARRGVAIEGPLQGSILQQVPYVTAYLWAWRDFFTSQHILPRRGAASSALEAGWP